MSNLRKEEFKNFNILVIGDDGIDKFVYGSAVRLAPEAPVPVLNPINETTNKGMAGNVVENLEALGCVVDFKHGVKTSIKTRMIDVRSKQQLLRVDQDSSSRPVKIEYDNLNEFNAIVISDYNKGFLTEEDILTISSNHDSVFLDSKRILEIGRAHV